MLCQLAADETLVPPNFSTTNEPAVVGESAVRAVIMLGPNSQSRGAGCLGRLVVRDTRERSHLSRRFASERECAPARRSLTACQRSSSKSCSSFCKRRSASTSSSLLHAALPFFAAALL